VFIFLRIVVFQIPTLRQVALTEVIPLVFINPFVVAMLLNGIHAPSTTNIIIIIIIEQFVALPLARYFDLVTIRII